MYPAFAKWIQSYRDLPLKVNQWANVVRWEFKNPQPFIRTREFLWQEGHTAFATKQEAEAEVLQILDLYSRVYEELLAVPVIKGRKSNKEKFAGGLYTTTVEAFVPTTGRGIQAATSHCLGQNFAHMFNIQFEDPTKSGAENNAKAFVWQNSWGLTTRTIGIMVMVHADDKGLVLPPRVASIQVVIVPCGITVNTTEADKSKLLQEVERVQSDLKQAGVRVKADLRDNYSPGWKFNHWELKGVPIRIEIGPRDVASRQVVACRRDLAHLTKEESRRTLSFDGLADSVKALLSEIQSSMFERAKKERDSHIVKVDEWKSFVPMLEQRNVVLSPWCGSDQCETDIKERSAKE